MATAKIDKEAVRQDLLAGMTPSELIKKYPCTRQYISLLKQGLVKQGNLPKSPAGRKPTIIAKPIKPQLDYDEATDTMIRAFEALKQKPELEDKIWRLENKNATLENEAKVLRSDKQKTIEKTNRLLLAQQKPEKIGV